tara:strand:- start:15827 stop:17815 length:1989 start_codon:yes stop_codon:yes gene_type:complete
MAGTASFNSATQILTVAADGLPSPVASGVFPNDNNSNTITEQDFDHDFLYRGGTFGPTRTFNSNQYTHDGFIRSISLISSDLNVFTGNFIQPGDEVLFVFSDGLKKRFIYRGTTFTSIEGEFWLATSDRLDLIMDTQENTPVSGTYEYFDARNSRSATPLGAIGIAGNGVTIFNPSAGGGLNPPPGFQWIAAGESPFVDSGEDSCGGHPETTGQYHYHDPHFIDCWNNNGAMAGYNDYYGSTQFNGDNLRHPDGHSKILGIAFDGFPIYGPYGYNSPFDNISTPRVMRTSYRVRDVEIPGRPDYGNSSDNPPAGTLMEDWEFVEGVGDLDTCNGRFCTTPEYTTGTYAYFVTVDENDTDVVKFPFIIGKTTRETIDTTFTNEPVQGGAQLPEVTITVTVGTDSVNGQATGVFYFNGVEKPANFALERETTKYIFNQDADSNATFGDTYHPLMVSPGEDGELAGYDHYMMGITYKLDGVPKTMMQYHMGFEAATTRRMEWVVPATAPNLLWYWCHFHTGQGNSFAISGGTVIPTLAFTLQPQNVTVSSGATATFTVQTEISPEDGPVTYQWYRSTDGGFAFSAVTGATTDTYQLTGLSYMTGYRYRCRITGPVGAPVQADNSPLDSQAAILTVTGGGDGGSTDNRFDSTLSTFDSTLQTYDGT